MNNFISLNRISKNFFINKKISVLKRINYNFNKGKIYSLMGPSGSGKSTLLNILSLIDQPSVGSMKIDGNNINFNNSSANDKIRAIKIGII
jgi:ABC-type lipoprotein export system ATPase subunit